ncbi:DUF1517 domain-containing protein [Lyngbya confervoides]|uniref:DUF1517 domain-containing protein n=1 Tax=Lyngbya confervoides BDU141951 TaxID=1574623 RepID=A0ABD4T548_9CYAN|nr:DUF1517 domain-containing protein [Lyngbya confervoides]MCM1983714.1 DUF1517 domain-containing protein [Lyngbya confervoides BDU141951]
MLKKFSLKTLFRSLVAIALVTVLFVGQASPAWAARSGGRIGGSAFRSRPLPSRSYNRAPQSYPRGGGYYPGGGFGFPFLLPFFGFGGVGSLFSILIFIAIANFVVSAFRRAGDGGSFFESADSSSNPRVTIAELQVGVLAEARHLQPELDQLALQASTTSTTGLTQLLQESTLALLRHPEYWAYADLKTETCRLTEAEAKFNRYALTERSKFQAETLSNVGGSLSEPKPAQNPSLVPSSAPGEYLLVTLLVAAQAQLDLPNIQSAPDLKTALKQLGGVSEDQMLALEVLWTPQATGDTLTSDDLLENYPTLKVLG